MSQDSYSFSCPVCAVTLSVPKSLAGVKGPCPHCRHEITAPVPDAEPSAPRVAAPAPRVAPSKFRAMPERVEADRDSDANRHHSGHDVETRRRSRRHSERSRRRPLIAIAAISVLLVAGAGAVALNFLPAGTLKRMLRLSGGPTVTAVRPAQPTAGGDSPAKPPGPDAPPSSTAADAPQTGATNRSETATTDPRPSPPETSREPSEPDTRASDPTKPAPVPAVANTEPASTNPPTSEPNGAVPSLLPDLKPDGPEDSNSKTTVARAFPIDPSQPAPSALPDDSLLARPLETLRKFLASPTWKERVQFVQVPEKVRADMEDYYRSHPDGPQEPTSVTFMTSARVPDGKYSVYLFHLTFPDLPQGFPAAVEETAAGWRVDWRSFVEFRDGHLRKFLSEYQELPASFQVKLQRTHYFDKDVPNLDARYCFRVSAPIYGHDGYVFVDKRDSIVGPKIADKLGWAEVHHVIAKLKWVKTPSGHQFVELRDIVANSWRAERDPRLGQNDH